MATVFWIGGVSSDPLDGDNWLASGDDDVGTLPTTDDIVRYDSDHALSELAGDITSLGHFHIFYVSLESTDQSYHRLGVTSAGVPNPLIIDTNSIYLNNSDYQGDNPDIKDSYGLYPNQSIIDMWDNAGVIQCESCNVVEGSRVTIQGSCKRFKTGFSSPTFPVDQIRGIIRWTDSARTDSTVLNGVSMYMSVGEGRIRFGPTRHPGMDLIFEPTIGVTIPFYNVPDYPDWEDLMKPISLGFPSLSAPHEEQFPNMEGVRVIRFRCSELSCVNIHNQVDVYIEPTTEVNKADPRSTSAAKQTEVVIPTVIERLVMTGSWHPVSAPNNQGANLYLYAGTDIEDFDVYSAASSIKFIGGNIPININGGFFRNGWDLTDYPQDELGLDLPINNIDISEVSVGQLLINNFDRNSSSAEPVDMSEGLAITGYYHSVLNAVPPGSYINVHCDNDGP